MTNKVSNKYYLYNPHHNKFVDYMNNLVSNLDRAIYFYHGSAHSHWFNDNLKAVDEDEAFLISVMIQ
jgi:3-deoxy-D-arabino-heptulosonate 7-phosphate (DAHP) synthase class II